MYLIRTGYMLRFLQIHSLPQRPMIILPRYAYVALIANLSWPQLTIELWFSNDLCKL